MAADLPVIRKSKKEMASTESSPFYNNPSTETDLKSMRLSQGRGVIRLNKILTPVDFSRIPKRRSITGFRLAQLTRASVLSLHVFELPEFSGCLPEAGSLHGDPSGYAVRRDC